MQDALYMMHDAGFRMARGNEGKESDGEEIASQELAMTLNAFTIKTFADQKLAR